MDNDKISIIVPVMDVELYLRECLESVLKQTYSNIEILLIYIQSKDAAFSICKETRNEEDIKNPVIGSHTISLETEEALAEFLVGSKFHGELWNKLFKVECIGNAEFIKTGIGNAEFIKTGIGQDIMFVWTVMQNAKNIVYTDTKGYFYRFNPNGITKRYKIENIVRKKEIYSMICSDVKSKYPTIQRQLYNRIAIVNAQNYVAIWC